MNESPKTILRALLPVMALVLWSCLSVQADTVYVTTYGSGGVSSSTLTPCNPNAAVASVCDNPLGATGITISTFGSTAIATPPGAPAHSKCIYGFTNGVAINGSINWSVQPQTLASPGAAYAIYVAHSSNGATNVLVTAYSADGQMSSSCTNSTAFDKAHSGNTWYLFGYITNNPSVTQPTIIFYMSGGYADNVTGGPGGAQRLYIDCFQFTAADPCLGVAGDVNVVGPLLASGVTVSVSGVSAGATNITVYGNAGEIGETNLVTGFAAGTVAVPVSALLDGDSITANQTKGGCVGNVSTAASVGSGPNPTLQVTLGVGKTNGLTGPIGANAGGTGAPLYWVHANGRRSTGFAVAPTGAYVITPSTNWVTLTFNSDTDEVYDWSDNTFPYKNTDNYAVLYGLGLAIDDTVPDIGPYQVYIDSIYNGTNLIQGFEASSFGTSYSNGTYGVMFLRPGAAGTPAGMLYSQPDTNYVNNAGGVNADTGTNSLLVSWAFKSTSMNNWVNLYTGGTGTPYPEIDLHQPVSIRMLVLPVGQTVGRRFDGSVSFMTNSMPAFWTSGSNTLGVTVSGAGTYTYQWNYAGNDIFGATDPSYTLEPFNGLSTNIDLGLYTVTVTDEGGGAVVRSLNLHVISDPVPTITNQPADVILQSGSPATFSVGADGHVDGGYPLTYQWYFNGNPVGTDSSALSIPSATTADVGTYTVAVSNSFGGLLSAAAHLAIISVAPGTGTGLRGDYYTLSGNGTNNFSGAPTLTRTDATVNFDWGTGSPDPLISADYFMVRWSGQVQALGTDTYTFLTRTDDGVRLWVNGQELVNDWTLHAPTTRAGSIALSGTQKYDLMMEYYENAVGAVAQLMWSNATTTIPQMTVPQSQLYPATGQVIPTLGASFSGSTLTLSWPMGTYTLVASTNVSGPYTNVAVGATSPRAITIGSAPQLFYRLKVQ